MHCPSSHICGSICFENICSFPIKRKSPQIFRLQKKTQHLSMNKRKKTKFIKCLHYWSFEASPSFVEGMHVEKNESICVGTACFFLSVRRKKIALIYNKGIISKGVENKLI
jgi:hypothetical protein